MVSLKWLGHAAWLIKFREATVLIDPFLSGNPAAAVKQEDLKGIDFILITHTHSDHVGDAFTIAKREKSRIIGMFELYEMAAKEGVDSNQLSGMNKGNMVDFGKIKVALTHADHSGEECGVVVSADGKTIYHAGDTALFRDMKTIQELYRPDVALLPIGGYFTMGPVEAAKAVEWLKPKIAVPMHFNTFPPIKQDPDRFRDLAGKFAEVKILEPGQEFTI
ncbi:MAG: metal-dependent hydrolase [Thermoplasmataceae archaeon]|nr:metal-dependent hydrolase [Candidatus Thermoplasmatota archaeon]